MNHNQKNNQSTSTAGNLELPPTTTQSIPVQEERKSNEREWMQLRDGTKEPVAARIELSDGRIAKIAAGKGKHSLESQEIFADESRDPKNPPKKSRLFSIQFSILITIDDKLQAPEDFEDLPMKDFNLIQVEYSQVNF